MSGIYRGKEGQQWADTLAGTQESKDRRLANKLFALLDERRAEDEADNAPKYYAEDVDNAYDDGYADGQSTLSSEILTYLDEFAKLSHPQVRVALLAARNGVRDIVRKHIRDAA